MSRQYKLRYNYDAANPLEVATIRGARWSVAGRPQLAVFGSDGVCHLLRVGNHELIRERLISGPANTVITGNVYCFSYSLFHVYHNSCIVFSTAIAWRPPQREVAGDEFQEISDLALGFGNGNFQVGLDPPVIIQAPLLECSGKMI